MENVVYILGAGFSAPLGLPVMSNFLMRAKDMFAANPEEYSHFKSVFGTIKKLSVAKNYYDTNLFNIEEILSILEMEGYLLGSAQKRKFIEFLASVIRRYTPDITPYPAKYPSNWYQFLLGSDSLWNWYGCFLGNLINLKWRKWEDSFSAHVNHNSGTSYCVVTLNYDMILEKAWQFARQLTEETTVHDYPMKSLEISKLHGSVEPISIVPPTWNKITDKLPKKNWKNAYKWLSKANHIRFIGYSLPITDSYVKYLLKASILQSPHLKTIDVICLDNSGDVEKRYDEFITFDFYRFRNGNAEDYLRHNYVNHMQRFRNIKRKGDAIDAPYDYLEDSHNKFMKGVVYE